MSFSGRVSIVRACGGARWGARGVDAPSPMRRNGGVVIAISLCAGREPGGAGVAPSPTSFNGRVSITRGASEDSA